MTIPKYGSAFGGQQDMMMRLMIIKLTTTHTVKLRLTYRYKVYVHCISNLQAIQVHVSVVC